MPNTRMIVGWLLVALGIALGVGAAWVLLRGSDAAATEATHPEGQPVRHRGGLVGLGCASAMVWLGLSLVGWTVVVSTFR